MDIMDLNYLGSSPFQAMAKLFQKGTYLNVAKNKPKINHLISFTKVQSKSLINGALHEAIYRKKGLLRKAEQNE